MGSIRWYTFIYEKPEKTHRPLGGIRIGESARLKTGERVPGRACGDGKYPWFELEPFGFVCADDTTTREFDTPLWRALASLRPRPGPYPYRYAYSMGAPLYNRVPTREQMRFAEWETWEKPRDFRPMGKWAHGHERLVDKDPSHVIAPSDPVPVWFRDHGMVPGSHWNHHLPKVRELPAGSGVSYGRAFEAEGRTWLLTPELLLVPADRVFAYQEQTFHGVELGKGVALPLAWIRAEEGTRKLRRRATGEFVASGERWGKHAHVLLTGRHEVVSRIAYWQARDSEDWVEAGAEAVVVTAVDRAPWGVGESDPWVDARIGPGWAVAYRGLTPVWTTLWSPGKGGVPPNGQTQHKKYAQTEVGTFAFQWKERVATMSPDSGAPTVFWFADVPHIQYVKPPLALHVSYWHQDYGRPMSAECMNFSPADADWLFGFTTPRLPEGWNAIRPSEQAGPGSRLVIRPE